MKPAARKNLHDPADRSPDAQAAVPARVRKSLGEQDDGGRRPVATLPLDDEELSDEAVRAVAEAVADHRAGRTHTSDEVKRELGI